MGDPSTARISSRNARYSVRFRNPSAFGDFSMSLSSVEPTLEGFGWSPFFHQQLLIWSHALESGNAGESASDRLPHRIAVDRGTEYGLLGLDGPRRAVLAGRLIRELTGERRP